MDYIKEKVAYLKGLTEGLGLDDTTSEGKVLLHIVEILDDMADALEGLADAQEELEEYVEVMDEDLADLEDDVYEDGLEEEIDFCEIECPECGEMVYVDMDMLDEENKIICPNCEEEIDIDLSCCCDDDHDQCDCH